MRRIDFASRLVSVLVLLISSQIPAAGAAARPAIAREWVRAWDGSIAGRGAGDRPSDIVFGPDGSVYIAGTSADEVGLRLFLVRYSPFGTVDWSRTIDDGYSGFERPVRLAIDRDGNVILMGNAKKDATREDFLVAKYDSGGNQLWMRTYDERGDVDIAESVAVDEAGNVYVSGIVGRSGPADIVTVKYSPAGSRLWTALYSRFDDLSCQVAPLSDGTVYVLGTTSFGMNDDILLIQYDSEGKQLWEAHYNQGGSERGSDDWPSRMIIDGSGNAYVVGYSEFLVSGSTERGSYGLVLIKYSRAGEVLWLRRHESAIERPQDLGWKASGLAFDPSGNVLVAGRHFDATAGYGWVTVKYSPAGDLLWETPYYDSGVGKEDDPLVDMAVDGSGNIFVLGSVPKFPNTNYTDDYRILQYSSGGALIREDRYDEGENDRAGAIAVSPSGDLYVTGASFQDYGREEDAVTIKYSLSNGLLFPVFVNGELSGTANRTRIVLANGGSQPAGGVIRFKDAHGAPCQVGMGGKSTDSHDYSIPAKGTLDLETDGTGPSVTGYIEVSPAEGANPPLEGIAFFTVLGNHVSVEDSPPRSSHQVYVSYNGGENTGAALYNPEDVPATVTATLLDPGGVSRATSQLVIQPKRQISRFVNEAEFFQSYFALNPGAFTGTLNLRVEGGRRVAALGLIQKGNGALISMVTSPNIRGGFDSTAQEEPANEARVLLFPQYVNGVSGLILNRTRVVVRNNSDVSDTGQIVFKNSDGVPSSAPVSGKTVERIPYALPAWGSVEFQTDGTGLLTSGVIEVDSQRGAFSGVEGTEVFDLLGRYVSVSSPIPGRSHRVYVSRTSLENTGIAIFYAGYTSLFGDFPTTIDVTLLDDGGNTVSEATLEMEPGQQRSLFVDEMFKTYFDSHPGDFRGTLSVRGRPVCGLIHVLGLIQKRADGALIAVPTSSMVAP